ncbi:MAG: hypothetical protein AVDCRST_MAG67-2788, partial [uncultured Solirubrobacteraceae bacterium]
ASVRRRTALTRRADRRAGSRRAVGQGQAALQPRVPDAAVDRGLPEGRRAAALDGARRRHRRRNRPRAAPAGTRLPRAAGRVRRRSAGLCHALARLRALLGLRRAQRAHRAAQQLVSDRARPAAQPAHGRLRARRRALLPAPAAGRGVGLRAVSADALGGRRL